MATIQPDLPWYTEISTAKQLSPRCPFASVHRCPRYYASLALLGEVGVATSIGPDLNQRLLEMWKRSDLWPVTSEQEAAVMCSDGQPRFFSNFCPEVSFDRFGWFASDLSYHADDIDADAAHRNLADGGASSHDWRWTWGNVKSLHYAECQMYSLLPLGVNETKSQTPFGFNP